MEYEEFCNAISPNNEESAEGDSLEAEFRKTLSTEQLALFGNLDNARVAEMAIMCRNSYDLNMVGACTGGAVIV